MAKKTAKKSASKKKTAHKAAVHKSKKAVTKGKPGKTVKAVKSAKSTKALKSAKVAKGSKPKAAAQALAKKGASKGAPKSAKTVVKASAKGAAARVKVAVKSTARVGAKATAKPSAHSTAKAAVKVAPKTTKVATKLVAEPAVKAAVVATKPVAAKGPTAKAKPKHTGPIVTTVRRGIVRTPADGDEDNEGYGFNLLAGPRNVTPYLAKSGEEYMGKEQIEHFRNILTTWKKDLMEEVDRTVTHMKDEAANPPDPNDRATLESEFSLELRTRDRERKLIRKIDEAIQRIEDGSYGYCLETGEEIGIKRLEARPVATLSIEAQERRERREKQYGDRDDRYR
jgi:DnaK suppressor protein